MNHKWSPETDYRLQQAVTCISNTSPVTKRSEFQTGTVRREWYSKGFSKWKYCKQLNPFSKGFSGKNWESSFAIFNHEILLSGKFSRFNLKCEEIYLRHLGFNTFQQIKLETFFFDAMLKVPPAMFDWVFPHLASQVYRSVKLTICKYNRCKATSKEIKFLKQRPKQVFFGEIKMWPSYVS